MIDIASCVGARAEILFFCSQRKDIYLDFPELGCTEDDVIAGNVSSDAISGIKAAQKHVIVSQPDDAVSPPTFHV